MKTSKIIERNKKAIILIDVLIPKENNQVTKSIKGTGFIISENGQFITCAHVYKSISQNELQYSGVMVFGKMDEKGIAHYNRYGLELLKIDEENDIALIKIVSDNKIKFETIKGFGDSEKIKEGEEVVFMGYPLALELIMMNFGITLSTNECIVSSIKKRGTDGSLHFLMVDTHINNGSSGSPLFLRKTGKVIGMTSGKISSRIPLPDGKIIDTPANMGICRPSRYIEGLINQ
jgi:S1-C subfamily serine protease